MVFSSRKRTGQISPTGSAVYPSMNFITSSGSFQCISICSGSYIRILSMNTSTISFAGCRYSLREEAVSGPASEQRIVCCCSSVFPNV